MCLPDVGRNIVDVIGYAVGFGIDEGGQLSKEQKHVQINSTDPLICLYNVPKLAEVGSVR